MVTGSLALEFSTTCAQAATHMRVCHQEPPLKVVRAFGQPDGAALVHLHNVSGGVLAGDQLEMRVHVRANALAQITSTSATRLYRQRGTSGVAQQRNIVQVDSGGLLEYVPDPIIPFAHAQMRQHTEIILAHDAGLIWWEVLSPGREAHGERFAYETLSLHTEICAGGIPIALEHLQLEPAAYALNNPAQFGPYGHYATFYACRVGADQDIATLETQLRELTQRLTQPEQAIWGVSALATHGVAIRGLAHNNRTLMSGLHTFWQCAKRVLYGRTAILPRKVK